MGTEQQEHLPHMGRCHPRAKPGAVQMLGDHGSKQLHPGPPIYAWTQLLTASYTPVVFPTSVFSFPQLDSLMPSANMWEVSGLCPGEAWEHCDEWRTVVSAQILLTG